MKAVCFYKATGEMSIAHLLGEIKATATRQALWKLVLDYYLSHGIDKISYHAADTTTGTDGIVTYGFPDDWVCHYIGDHLEKVDPIPDLANATSYPFRWSEARHLSTLSRENLAYLDELEASGIGDGLAFCVFGPKLRNAYVGLGFENRNVPPTADDVIEFQLVAQMAHLQFCKLSDERPQRRLQLTAREKEVLEWVARGKSNPVIGEIMNISPHTVDSMMRRICEKLGVADRTTAAIKALGSGLLQYQDIKVA